VLDQRSQLLRAALGFAGLPRPSYDRALHALRSWLDSWSGVGHVALGMHRQGFDLQLTRYDERGWRATFYTTGMEHSPTNAAIRASTTPRASRRCVGPGGRLEMVKSCPSEAADRVFIMLSTSTTERAGTVPSCGRLHEVGTALSA
jgi:hypothetical protein